ncbi:glycerophosphodiester phosphodiesterase family protein [Jannaschia sp. 2305UL9-9]|uniref:glycerophosphodiester phosphodiesterase family protein n=1 Tax=Jannaschia sp. 2305UL9-9 TaxID=3121638 RepID=UPI003529682C
MTSLPDSFLRGHIAHRALHDRQDGRPENSLAAIQAAVDLGVAIELDVQPSADGQAMVFHDDTLDRLTAETGPIDARTADELTLIPLLGGHEGIPTLPQVLALVDGRVPLLIEVKDRDGQMGPNIGGLEDATLAALAGYSGDVALMSFNPNSVAYLAAQAPHIPRGIVTSAYSDAHWPELTPETRAHLAAVPDLDRTKAAFISHEVGALTMPRVAEIKAQGLPILCWTVRSAEQEAQARQIADAVTFEGYLP